jgi:hypothetical protein
MPTGRSLPTDALAFIRRCVRERKVHWTYHVNMRLAGRYISREELLGATESYEIIESYAEDNTFRVISFGRRRRAAHSIPCLRRTSTVTTCVS